MTKSTVYLDTNIISSYWYSGLDIAARARRLMARECWRDERRNFAIWVSVASEDELAAGKYRRQADCLRFVRRLSYLPINAKVRRFAGTLVEAGVVPAENPGDALQMAVSAVYRIDYLLSWNYAHLVNPVAQRQLEGVCQKQELRAPLLVSPESIPRVGSGQTVQRRHS
jgi:hypothetical protein